jgi:hypothetical protein
MSTPPSTPGRPMVIPGLDSSDRPVPAYVGDTRYPLGLPAGSVRALLAFSVLGLLWALVLTYRNKPLPPIFPYLEYLMILILAHFFAAHGSSIGGPGRRRSPLFLPRGSVRLLLTLGVAGLVGWVGYYWDEYEKNLPVSVPYELPLVLLGGFLAGYVFHRLVQSLSGGQAPFWFQDVEAWLALLGVLALAVTLVFHVLIKPSLENPDAWEFKNLEVANPIVAAIISFYFGARS